MKTAYDLLMDAPDDQVTRCKIALREIAAGNWLDAGHFLTNAARESNGQWAADVSELAAFCLSKADECAERIAA